MECIDIFASRWAASQRNETAPHGCLVATFCTCWPCDPDLWPCDLIVIDGRGIVMDYLCAKFDNFGFSRFGFIVRTERITWQNQRRMIAILTRLPSAWIINTTQCHNSYSHSNNITTNIYYSHAAAVNVVVLSTCLWWRLYLPYYVEIN